MRTFLRSKAVDTTYEIRFNEKWHGRKVSDILNNLMTVCEEMIHFHIVNNHTIHLKYEHKSE